VPAAFETHQNLFAFIAVYYYSLFARPLKGIMFHWSVWLWVEVQFLLGAAEGPPTY